MFPQRTLGPFLGFLCPTSPSATCGMLSEEEEEEGEGEGDYPVGQRGGSASLCPPYR